MPGSPALNDDSGPLAPPDRPRRLDADDPDLHVVLNLIQGAFAYMDGRVDPPSSMHDLTVETLARQAAESEIWVVGTPPVACVALKVRKDSLCLGKLAVVVGERGRGLARLLVDLAERRARELGLPWLELRTRVELFDNQAVFSALGFHVSGEIAHPGFDHPTSLVFRRPVSLPAVAAEPDRRAPR